MHLGQQLMKFVILTLRNHDLIIDVLFRKVADNLYLSSVTLLAKRLFFLILRNFHELEEQHSKNISSKMMRQDLMS